MCNLYVGAIVLGLMFLQGSAFGGEPRARYGVFPDCVGADLNHDYIIDNMDVTVLTAYLNGTGSMRCHEILHADVNRDRILNQADIDIIQSSIAIGEYPPAIYIWGDITLNQRLERSDLEDLELLITNGHIFSDGQVSIADMDGDGDVSMLDYEIITQCLIPGGYWSPFNMAIPMP